MSVKNKMVSTEAVRVNGSVGVSLIFSELLALLRNKFEGIYNLFG
jgi:hypothetical protein